MNEWKGEAVAAGASANLQGRNREEYLANIQYKIGQIAALQHPYLLPIEDYGVHRNIPFIVTPEGSDFLCAHCERAWTKMGQWMLLQRGGIWIKFAQR